tara:strand:+ start:589 stop:906 length:318 start_codon:yes stop_codon:yes gene_type:complete
LATGSHIREKEEALHRIEVLQPLWDQVAIALEHARLYRELQEEISERKLVEDVLKAKENQWDLFFHATSNMLWNWNFADDSVERNAAFATTLGYANEDIVPTISW